MPSNGTLVFENAAGPPTHARLVGKLGITVPPCDRADFKLFHTVPLLANGWGLVGEASKWVPVSAVRIRSVTAARSHSGYGSLSSAAAPPVSLQLSGPSGERVSFGFVAPAEKPGDGAAELPITCASRPAPLPPASAGALRSAEWQVSLAPAVG